MSGFINKPFLIKMLEETIMLFFFLYSGHHEMAVLPSHPKHYSNIQCLLDWNMHASYIGKETVRQQHSSTIALLKLSICWFFI